MLEVDFPTLPRAPSPYLPTTYTYIHTVQLYIEHVSTGKSADNSLVYVISLYIYETKMHRYRYEILTPARPTLPHTQIQTHTQRKDTTTQGPYAMQK